MLVSAARRVASMLFGGRCFLCRGASPDGQVLCAPCRNDLPGMPAPQCPCCALPSPDGAICGRCLAKPPLYDATVAALVYAFPADVLVQSLKYRGELALAPLLGELLAAALPADAGVDIMLPVPLSGRRLRERGYNQAVEIARALPRTVQLAPVLCARVRDTPAQSDLPWAERARNVRDAFRCTRALDGLSVAVIDDVMTTGATLDAVAGALKRAGAARVVNWVVARTLPPRDA
ncbi:MAG: ComF family protein [Burkholderiales bacterium]|nr:ComF family protein [Burkholderiales bacterium]